MISALQALRCRCPRVGFCDDEAVNGAPFYVMGLVEGRSSAARTRRATSRDERRAIGERVVDTLVAIHAVDPDAVGLGELGRKEAYVERQLRRWQGQWEKSKTRELAAGRAGSTSASLPGSPNRARPTIVHRDYRLDNMDPRRRRARSRAVVDWELCTLGDPLADVGHAACLLVAGRR